MLRRGELVPRLTSLRLDLFVDVLVESLPARERKLSWLRVLGSVELDRTIFVFACGPVGQLVALLVNVEGVLQVGHAAFHSWNQLVVRRRSEYRGPLADAAWIRESILSASSPRHQLRVVSGMIRITLVFRHVTIVPRVQKVVGILDLGKALLVKQLLDCVGDWLGHKLESMLSLDLVGIVEPGVLVEIPVDLLNLRHLPTVVLLSLSSIRLIPSSYFSLSLQSYLPSRTIDLLPQFLAGLVVVINRFIAVVFLPSLGLSSCQHNRLLSENASLIGVTIIQVAEERSSMGAHVLRLIERVNPLKLFVRMIERVR